MVTLEEAARQGAELLARAAAKAADLPAEEAAQRAWYPGGPSVEELTERMTSRRAARAA